MVTVTLVTKDACPLCEEAERAVEAARRRVAFHLVVRGIEGDPDLARRYALEVPVVLVAGVKRFFGRVSEAMLVREVVAAERAARPPDGG